MYETPVYFHYPPSIIKSLSIPNINESTLGIGTGLPSSTLPSPTTTITEPPSDNFFFPWAEVDLGPLTNYSYLKKGLFYDISLEIVYPNINFEKTLYGNVMFGIELKNSRTGIVAWREERPILFQYYQSSFIQFLNSLFNIIPIMTGLKMETKSKRIFLGQKIRENSESAILNGMNSYSSLHSNSHSNFPHQHASNFNPSIQSQSHFNLTKSSIEASSQTESSLPIITNNEDSIHSSIEPFNPTICKLWINTNKIPIERANLLIAVHFTGLRWWMYYWPIATGFIMIGFIYWIQMSIAFLWFLVSLIILITRTKNRNHKRQERESKEKIKRREREWEKDKIVKRQRDKESDNRITRGNDYQNNDILDSLSLSFTSKNSSTSSMTISSFDGKENEDYGNEKEIESSDEKNDESEDEFQNEDEMSREHQVPNHFHFKHE